MKNNCKKTIVCLPDQTNISGVMTMEFAKSHAEEQCPDPSKTITIVVLNYSSDKEFYCLERKEGEWREKEILELKFNPLSN